MARAPMFASSSMIRFASRFSTMVRTPNQPSSCSFDTVGACMPGATALAASSACSGQS